MQEFFDAVAKITRDIIEPNIWSVSVVAVESKEVSIFTLMHYLISLERCTVCLVASSLPHAG